MNPMQSPNTGVGKAMAFEPPSQSAWMYNEQGQRVGHISLGGAILEMPLPNGKTQLFEMHNYFGPIPVSRVTHDPLQRNPSKAFWLAFARWTVGGELVDGNRCVLRDDVQACLLCKGDGFMGRDQHPCPECGGKQAMLVSKSRPE